MLLIPVQENLQPKSSQVKWIYSIQKDRNLIQQHHSDTRSLKQEMEHLWLTFHLLEQMLAPLPKSRVFLKMKAAKPKSEMLTCVRRLKMFRKSSSKSWTRWSKEEMATLDQRPCQWWVIFLMATTCQDLKESINHQQKDWSHTKTPPGLTRNVSTTISAKATIPKRIASHQARHTLLRLKAVSCRTKWPISRLLSSTLKFCIKTLRSTP